MHAGPTLLIHVPFHISSYLSTHVPSFVIYVISLSPEYHRYHHILHSCDLYSICSYRLLKHCLKHMSLYTSAQQLYSLRLAINTILPTTKWVVAISEAITDFFMRLGVPIAQKRRHVADEVCNPFQGIVPRPQRPGNVLRTLLLGPDPKHDNGMNF